MGGGGFLFCWTECKPPRRCLPLRGVVCGGRCLFPRLPVRCCVSLGYSLMTHLQGAFLRVTWIIFDIVTYFSLLHNSIDTFLVLWYTGRKEMKGSAFIWQRLVM